VFHDVESWLQAEALASTRAGIAQIPEDVLEDLSPAEKVEALLGNPVRDDTDDSIQAVNFVKSSSNSSGLEDWRHRGLEVKSSKSSANFKAARPRKEINRKNARRTEETPRKPSSKGGCCPAPLEAVVPLPLRSRQQRKSENQSAATSQKGTKLSPRSEISELSTTEPSSNSDDESSDEDDAGFCYSFQSAGLHYAQPRLQQQLGHPEDSCPVMQAAAMTASEKVRAFFESSAYVLEMDSAM